MSTLENYAGRQRLGGKEVVGSGKLKQMRLEKWERNLSPRENVVKQGRHPANSFSEFT